MEKFVSPPEAQLPADSQNPAAWQFLVAASRRQAAAELAGRSLPPPEDLIRQMRASRDAALCHIAG